MKRIGLALCVGLMAASMGPAVAADDFASEVVGYSTLALDPYDYPGAALGKPTLSFFDYGEPDRVFTTSLVVGPNNMMPGYDTSDPNSGKVVVTVKTGGYLTVKFAEPIEDDPQNWFGQDFIVFGNAGFNGSGSVAPYVDPDSDMEKYFIDSYGAGRWESATVSVSQYENGPWVTYIDGPFADNFAPTQAYAWDYINHKWGPEMDFTKPLDPALTKDSFGERQVGDVIVPLSAAEGIDLYKGSGGGTAFDLSGLDLPLNTSGRKWIQYIKITGRGCEVDAISRVSHEVAPVTIGQAKRLPDGARVIITEATVSAGTDDFADCCYVQAPNSSAAIKVSGRVVARGTKVKVYGVMATTDGEREIRSTAMEITTDTAPAQ